METVGTSSINSLFLQNANEEAGLKKIAQETTNFIRKRLREVSFARKIVNPMWVTPGELRNSTLHDGLVKIVEIEPDSKAMSITIRGDADYSYVEGERFEIPFFVVSSDNFQKTEDELAAYANPITEIIERNSVFDIQEAEDKAFISHVDAAIALEELASSGSKLITGTFDTDGSIKKKDFVNLFDTLDGDKLSCDLLLMSKTMFNKLALYQATTAGSDFASNVMVNGYNYASIFGKRVVVSNKVDLLGNNIYAFTHQDFFGQFLIFNDTKFWIKKEKNIITWSSYETIGMGIGNTRAVAKLSLS